MLRVTRAPSAPPSRGHVPDVCRESCRATRDAYLQAANELKLATGPYKAARDAYVAGTATYTKSLYE